MSCPQTVIPITMLATRYSKLRAAGAAVGGSRRMYKYLEAADDASL